MAEITADLRPHLAREDQVVFPAIRRQAKGSPTGIDLPGAVWTLRAEHEALGGLLTRMRTATSNYLTPADGCVSYRGLYRRLAHLEADTHLHIHLEKTALFPAAMTTPSARSQTEPTRPESSSRLETSTPRRHSS